METSFFPFLTSLIASKDRAFWLGLVPLNGLEIDSIVCLSTCWLKLLGRDPLTLSGAEEVELESQARTMVIEAIQARGSIITAPYDDQQGSGSAPSSVTAGGAPGNIGKRPR